MKVLLMKRIEKFCAKATQCSVYTADDLLNQDIQTKETVEIAVA
jgi:hypothetical protein